MPEKYLQKKQSDEKNYENLLIEMDKTAKLLVRRDLELNRVNAELDETIYQLKEDEKKLKEMNEVLEIRLNARTKELRENILSLDGQVKERTRKLENSKIALMNILEDFRRQKILTEDEQKKNLAIINNFPDGLLIFDNHNKLSIINKKAKEYLGISQLDYIYHESWDVENVLEFKSLMKVIGSDIKIVFKEELDMGPELILEVSVQEYSEMSMRYGKFVILHDITREKKVQSLKSEFVSIAAHQLRTPLSAIKWTLTSLLDGDFGALSDDQRKYLGKTNLSNERMINLVDDLLNLSRIEEGRYIYKTSVASIYDLLNTVLKAVELKANEKKIKLSTSIDKHLPDLTIDEEKIKLVMQNLVENAINYSRRESSVKIEVTDDINKNEVIFSIKDSGIGIPEDQRERIFTKFFRAENAVRAETVGSGLGLFIDKNIIEAHKGRIWFESELDKGSTFYFTIPYAKKDEQFFGKF
ncbi:MAG: ATP-binding protein [Candidatus Paceibacterota bacterium]|jgi:signal transduction histidine kinase